MQVTTGSEGASLYAIWLAANHHPLYSDPWNPPFSFTPYNFGFYWSYGLLARMLGIHDAGLLLFSRLLTLVFALCGACVMAALVRLALNADRKSRTLTAVAAMLALVAWTGSNSTVWWALSARPDMASCAFTLLGCYLYARHLAHTGHTGPLLAGLSFAAAWAFKQSTIWSAVACFLFALLLRRRWKEAALLAAPGVVLVAAALLLAPRAYWSNIVTAPALEAILPRLVVNHTLEVLLPNLAFFAVPLAALAHPGLRRRLLVSGTGCHPQVVRLLYVVAALTSAFGITAVGREGASRNQFFEGMFACAVLCAIVLIACFLQPDSDPQAPGRPTRWLFIAALLLMLPFPLLTLARPNVESGRLHWNLTWLNAATYSQRMQMQAALQQLPQPVLTRDEVLSLPWNSTSSAYPAPVTVWIWYDLAQRHQRLHGSFDAEIAARRVPTLLLTPDDPWVRTALASGYTVRQPFRSAFTPMGQHQQLLVLVR